MKKNCFFSSLWDISWRRKSAVCFLCILTYGSLYQILLKINRKLSDWRTMLGLSHPTRDRFFFSTQFWFSPCDQIICNTDVLKYFCVLLISVPLINIPVFLSILRCFNKMVLYYNLRSGMVILSVALLSLKYVWAICIYISALYLNTYAKYTYVY